MKRALDTPEADGLRMPRMLRAIGGMVVLAVALVAGLVLCGLWLVGFPDVAASRRLSLTNLFDLLKLAFAVVAGIGGVVALVVAYRRQRVAEAADGRDAERLLHERFQKASEQLGNEAAAVRLAGVYAMASLADDWPHQRQSCVDVLCAYLRMNFDPAPPDDPGERRAWHGERQVRQSVVRVIVQHLRDDAAVSWQRNSLDFTGVVFSEGDSFSGATFLGRRVFFGDAWFGGRGVSFRAARFGGEKVSFRRAHFTGGRASFQDAVFSGPAVLFRGAHFDGGEVVFTGAEFTSERASFGEARFAGAEVRFDGARFADGAVSFGEAQFTGGIVTFFNADFAGARVSFHDTAFSGGEIHFSDAHFTAGSVSFANAKFHGSRVGFDNVKLRGGIVDLSKAERWEVPPAFSQSSDAAGLRLPEAPVP